MDAPTTPKKIPKLAKGNAKPLGCSPITADKAAAAPAKSVASSTSMARQDSDSSEDEELTYEALDDDVGNFLSFDVAAKKKIITTRDSRQRVCTTMELVGFNGLKTFLTVWGGDPDDESKDKIGKILRNMTEYVQSTLMKPVALQ